MPDSPLMSQAEAMEFLCVDKKGLEKMLVERGLRRHPEFKTLFSRRQVEETAKQIEQEITYGNAGDMGQQSTAVGGVGGARTVAQVVP